MNPDKTKGLRFGVSPLCLVAPAEHEQRPSDYENPFNQHKNNNLLKNW
jgi:hypothetical protein